MRLYAVTDRMWLGQNSLPEQVEECIRGGATCIQIREKDISFDEYVKLAIEIKKVTGKHDIPFIVNDDTDVAIACKADGIHVGQHDMQAGEVRKKAGGNMIIGVSAQNVEQAVLAEGMGADYIGVGAVFSTATKADASDVTYETLKAICEAVSIPVVAIGGISKNNIMELKGSGADGVAVVSAIFAQENIYEAAKELRALSDSCFG
ncbi:thiamine-phosphate pyrophosphorylase [Ruminiclostridium sufflavum DSM 19573]|uniref:Thiamine-phosphate synthase n=2 Tax=Ruminiclostridium TaxID=1508657 RepID=A0A318Y9J9_9FIRM|nr:thiamine-phosphate pyrophosphorylase [Ruminiclostridium sufflavum DSM 19573]